MPFIDDDPSLAEPRTPGMRLPTPLSRPTDTSWGSLLGAAARQENTMVSAYNYLTERTGFASDPDHNPIDIIKDTEYEALHLDRFVGSRSEGETRSIMARIDRETEDRRILDSSGFAGFAAQAAMGMLDPTILLPAGTIYRGARIGRAVGRSALSAGAATGAMMAGQEAILYGSQELRTPGESTINIATGVIVGGILGGAIGFATSRELRQITDVMDGFRKDLNTEIATGTPTTGGAAAAGAAPAQREGLNLTGALGAERAAAPLSPVTRLQTSPFESARATIRDLGDGGLSYRENWDGVPTSEGGTVETRVKMYRAPLIEAIRLTDDAYARYFFGKQNVGFFERQTAAARAGWARMTGQGGGKHTAHEFREEVGKAMRRLDKHPIPEVEQAAKPWRDLVFVPPRDRAIQLGILDKKLLGGDGAVLGAMSYLTRVYNRERIKQQRDVWTRILLRHFTEMRTKASAKFEARQGAKIKALETEIADLRTPAEARPALEAQLRDEFNRLQESNPAYVALDQRLRGMRSRAAAATKAAPDAERMAAHPVTPDGSRVLPSGKPVLIEGFEEQGGQRFARFMDPETGQTKFWPADQLDPATPGTFDFAGDARAAVRAARDAGGPEYARYVSERVRLAARLRRVQGQAAPTEPPRTGEAPPPAPGMVRVYHGGTRERPGEWVSTSRPYAQQYADRSVEPTLWYLDIPNTDARLFQGGWQDQGVGQGFDFNFKLSPAEERALKPLVGTQPAAAAGTRPERIAAFDATASAERAALRKDMDERLEILDQARDRELEQAKSIYQQRVAASKRGDRPSLRSQLREAEARISEAHARAARKVEREFAPMLRKWERANSAARKRLLSEMTAGERSAARAADLDERLGRERARRADDIAGLEPEELPSLVDDVTNTIMGESVFRLAGLSIVQGPRGPLRARVLNIPDEAIEEFLESDVEKVARIYTQSMASDIELAAKFGDVRMTDQLTRLREELNAKTRAIPEGKKHDKARAKLQRQYETDKRDIEALRDRIRGNYRQPEDPEGIAYRAGRTALNLNYVARLGGMTISSLSDAARPIMRYGLNAFRDGWMPLVTNLQAVKLSAREVRLAGTALDMVRDQRAMELADLLDDFGRNTKFERGVQMTADRFGMLSLMSPWNGALKSMAGVITMAEVLRATRAVAAGKATKKQIANLAAGGVDDAMARRIWAEAEKSGSQAGRVFLPNTEAWKDRNAIQAFRAVINREVDNLIVTPGLEKPLWTSAPMGRIIGQFKAFSFSSTQRVTLAGLQQRDAAALSGVLVAMSIGAMTSKIKAELRKEDTSSWTHAKWISEALDNSGLLGIMMEVNNISEKVSGGNIGLSRFSGKQISRYASRNWVGALAGPSFDAAADLVTLGRLTGPLTGADAGWSRADTHAVRKVIPLQNLLYLRWLFDYMEEGVNSGLNLPERRPRRVN